MPTKWGRKVFYNESEACEIPGVTPEILAIWRASERILTINLGSTRLYEEQSLRACVARNQKGKGKS